MSFAAIILCVPSQCVFVVVSLSTQFGNFWIHSCKITDIQTSPRMYKVVTEYDVCKECLEMN